MRLLEQAYDLARTGKCQGEIQNVTTDDVRDLKPNQLKVLHDIMVAPHVGLALVTLQNAGFFDWLIPEIKDSLALKSSKQFKEIWPHTLLVITQTPPKRALRWSALFHDLGKAKSFSIKGNKVTFHHHEKISAKIFERFARKSEIFGKGQRNRIYYLVYNLGYAEGYDRNWTDSAVRRFTKEVDIYLDDLLTLSESDITTGNPKRRNNILNRIDHLRNRIIEVRTKDAKLQSALPKGLGIEIAKVLGIPIGPKIGLIRKELETKIGSGELSPNEDFGYYIEYLKKNPVETANTKV